jgi:RHS repeat-associated protein
VDRLARVTYPEGRTLDYRYTPRGLLTEVPGILNRIDYNEHGLATRREYANGAVSTAHYDTMDRVDAVGTTTRGQTAQALAIDYDRVGNVSSLTDSVHASGPLAVIRTFGYDDLYRLRTAGGVAGQWSYDFDASGNWTSKSDRGGYSYGGKPHQPSTVAGATGYVFDEAGHLTSRPGSKQTYDAKGRLTSVTLDDGTVVGYRYDYAGMVAVKETTGPGGHHRTVYADKLAEERDGQLVDYVFAAGLRIARVGGEHLDPMAAGMLRLPPVTGATGLLTLLLSLICAPFRSTRRRRVPALAAFGLAFLIFDVGCGGDGPKAAPSVSGAVYYHHDHLGGVVLETDESGAVVGESSFDPYGGDLKTADEPYAFTGKERDPHTGLYDFGARVYDPKLGLFLSPDPAALDDPELTVEDPQLLSIYAYARNNPTSHIDPDGRLPHILAGALAGGLIGAGSYLVKAANSGNFSWKSLGASTAGGAVSGAIAAATGGASLFVQGAVSNVGGGIVSRAIETGSFTQAFAPTAIKDDAINGAVAGGIARAGATVASTASGAVKSLVSRAKDVVTSRAAASAARGGAARFTQTTASPMFSAGGKFAGKSISQVADGLRSGGLSSSEVPVEIIVRNGEHEIITRIEAGGDPRGSMESDKHDRCARS